jgi:hypothetical protein
MAEFDFNGQAMKERRVERPAVVEVEERSVRELDALFRYYRSDDAENTR